MSDVILVIAGSDSCAGAGMQIDLKTAAAHGVHATCALTAVTAQNTTGVDAVAPVEPSLVAAQIRAACADLPPAAIKIGMLGSGEVAAAVAECLDELPDVPIVLDPVLVATSGGTLADADAFECIRCQLLPRAAIVTPNIPEAAALSGGECADEAGIAHAAAVLRDAGAHAVLVKGGHGAGDTVVDRLYRADGVNEYTSRRLPGEYHGTGCSLATAIACNLARGADVEHAVEEAHAFLANALAHATGLGHGSRIFDPLAATRSYNRT